MTKSFYSILVTALFMGTGILLPAENNKPGATSSTEAEPKVVRVTKSLDAKSNFVAVGTNRIHYIVEGKGHHDLVLVHCWAGNLGFWNDQLPALKDKARLILLDLPGHGQSDKPHTTYTMDFFADAVLAVMKETKSSKATLIGHSMGVPVICTVFKHAPEKVAALISVDGALRRPKMTSEQAEQFVARFRSAEYKENVRRFMGSMFPTPGTETVRDRVISEILETPQYVMIGAMEGMFQVNQPDWDLRRVEVPVMVINAPNPMWTEDYKEYVRGLSPKSEYRSFDGVGHWLMLERPKEFNAALTEMLSKFDLIDK